MNNENILNYSLRRIHLIFEIDFVSSILLTAIKLLLTEPRHLSLLLKCSITSQLDFFGVVVVDPVVANVLKTGDCKVGIWSSSEIFGGLVWRNDVDRRAIPLREFVSFSYYKWNLNLDFIFFPFFFWFFFSFCLIWFNNNNNRELMWALIYLLGILWLFGKCLHLRIHSRIKTSWTNSKRLCTYYIFISRIGPQW